MRYYTAAFSPGLTPIIASIAKISAATVLIVCVAIGMLWARSYFPGEIEPADLDCSTTAPEWSAGSPLKVMSYNVQYMASKNYVFFYDIDVDDPKQLAALENADKALASRPSREHVYWTIDKVAELIRDENPDVVLLQEVNGGDDSRTHYTDQGAELLSRLSPGLYPCQTEASYWKAEFVFHPQVLGPVNMKLLTLSKYRIQESLRHQLPRKPSNFLVAPFDFQRALLESHIASGDGRVVAVINTHFDAWGAGTGIMERQIAKTESLLQSLDSADIAWVLGGDLNLLPPDNNRQRQRILSAGTGNYDENPQIKPLYDKYRGIPSLKHLSSSDPRAWYTHFPNDPKATGPDRTIDYQFYSKHWTLDEAYIIQDEALHISDHLPVVGHYSMPATSREEGSAR